MRGVWHYAERAFRQVLDEFGRYRAPALIAVETSYRFETNAIEFEAHFSDIDRHWLVDRSAISRRERDYALDQNGPCNNDLRSLYSRLYEDHLIETDLRVARERFVDVCRRAPNPDVMARARDLFDRERATIMRWHRGARPIGLGGERDPVQDGVAAAFSRRLASEVERAMMGATVAAPTDDAPTTLTMEALQRAADMMRSNQLSPELYSRYTFSFLADGVTFGDVGDTAAQEKGLTLLTEWLSPEQRAQYKANQWFEVRGGSTGRRYRIRHGRQQNIEELDRDGNRVAGLCFLPEGQLVAGDVMLAQKIALETDELKALAVANRF